MDYHLLDPNWDKNLAELNGSFLQSTDWAEFQQKLGREVVRASGQGWQWQAVVRGRKGLTYLLCSYGPVAKDAKAAHEGLGQLIQAGKARKCDFVRAEPQQHRVDNKIVGARQISEVQPQHTQVLDLTQTVEDLRKGLASGHRNLINGIERRGVVIGQSVNKSDLNQFLDMLDDTAARAKVTFYPKRYYEGLWNSLQSKKILKLYIATAEMKDGRTPVAAALFYDWNGTRIYAHAGAYQVANRMVNASVSLVWQAILDAKAAGMKQFDLWGVAPTDDRGHKWAGITKFKKGFGGQQLDYTGTWDIPLNRPKYAAYSLYRKLKGQD